MFVVNSRLGFSSVAGPGSNRRGLHQFRPSFSRSYGCNLQSSLTRVFPRTLGFSPQLPVSVCGTGPINLARSFSRQCGPLGFGSPIGLPPCHVSAFTRGICLPCSLPASTRSSIRAPKLPPASLHHSNDSLRYWNVCQLSIAYACCLGLGPD